MNHIREAALAELVDAARELVRDYPGCAMRPRMEAILARLEEDREVVASG